MQRYMYIYKSNNILYDFLGTFNVFVYLIRISMREISCSRRSYRRIKKNRDKSGALGVFQHIQFQLFQIRQFVPLRILTSANICIRKSCANICLVPGNIYLSRKLSWPPNLLRCSSSRFSQLEPGW